MKAVALGLSLLLASVSVCSAQDFAKGVAAYNAKDYATALKEWRPLAEQGNASAQYNLGLMYDNGQGVTQDYKEAVRLYGLAAAQGNASAQSNLGLMCGNGQRGLRIEQF
ncbi:MAG: sel1 repeat family protein, partial [Rhodospirillaceae bacterium]|nr:sel1 repeat family protein [Rhodospirillaceae bacterium]